MSEEGVRVEYEVHFRRDRRARKVVHRGPAPTVTPDLVPRIARLLALAHKWEGMVRRGEVKDYAEIARLSGLTRMRVSQIVSMTLLAPDIQEAVLLTAAAGRGRSIPEHHLRVLVGESLWTAQGTIIAIRLRIGTHFPIKHLRVPDRPAPIHRYPCRPEPR